MRGSKRVQLKPVTMLRQECKSSWLPVDQGDQSNKVTADFSLSNSMTDYFDDIELHWLRGNLDRVADAAGLTRWHAKLAFQEILGAESVASTHVGHYFIATTVQDGHPCVLDVFVMTHEPRQLHFILASSHVLLILAQSLFSQDKHYKRFKTRFMTSYKFVGDVQRLAAIKNY